MLGSGGPIFQCAMALDLSDGKLVRTRETGVSDTHALVEVIIRARPMTFQRVVFLCSLESVPELLCSKLLGVSAFRPLTKELLHHATQWSGCRVSSTQAYLPALVQEGCSGRSILHVPCGYKVMQGLIRCTDCVPDGGTLFGSVREFVQHLIPVGLRTAVNTQPVEEELYNREPGLRGDLQ